MKIMVAQSTASALAGHESTRETLCAMLEGRGHKIEKLDLPSIANPRRAVINLASYRLMGTAASADALICLDPVAAVLNHPRKLALLLDDSYLVADEASLPHETGVARRYIANVLRSSLDEARHIFVASRFASQRLRQLGVDRGEEVRPEPLSAQFAYPRHPGSELLVLNDVNERHRPDLLIACLAALPEPFRARWIASRAEPQSLARLLALVRDAGLEQRFAVDVRTIAEGERSYLLSQAAALIELAPGLLIVSETSHEALRRGVPIITCIDGGALSELAEQRGFRPAKADGAALASAVRDACDGPVKTLPSAPRAKPAASGWAPLVKALTK